MYIESFGKKFITNLDLIQLIHSMHLKFERLTQQTILT